jgi:UDPglucose 6-dehydrogenase
MSKRLSVIGLGKLGACTAGCFASKGFEVIGVDINKDFVDAINNGKPPIYEPGLQELIISSKNRLSATQDYEYVMRKSDVTFLIVPTPSRPDGHFSDRYLMEALKHLSVAFKKINKRYHLFVVTSTVSPGSIEDNLIPLVESVSGKKLNKGFGICYNPEFIALGSVLKDFLNPDMVLIGESNKFAGDILEEIYKITCDNDPYIARMSIVSAEIAKISLNSFITMKISFANTLSNICEKISGANVDAITKALGADKRISPYYFKGGLGYGGPCFPRDNKAFAGFAERYDYDALLAKATDEINQFQVSHVVKKILEWIPKADSTVSVLGLSYKPNTIVIEESPGIKIIEELLKERDIEIIAYDPLAMDNVKSHFGDNIVYVCSTRDCFLNSSICVITTQAEEFKLIDNEYIVNNPTIIIDCWRILDASRFDNRVRYIALGKK